MGLMDAINPEDRISIPFSTFYELVKQSTRADMAINGIRNLVDHDAMLCVLKGEHLPETKPTAIKEEKKVK